MWQHLIFFIKRFFDNLKWNFLILLNLGRFICCFHINEGLFDKLRRVVWVEGGGIDFSKGFFFRFLAIFFLLFLLFFFFFVLFFAVGVVRACVCGVVFDCF